MTSAYQSRSIQRSPDFEQYKVVSEAPDGGGPYTEKKHGVATDNWLSTIIDVAVSASANPSVNVLFWSEAAGQFVADDGVSTVAAKGAGVSWQKIVNSAGRVMFVEVLGTVGANQTVTISVAGTELEHP